MITEVVATQLTGEGLTNEQRERRDDLLDELLDHIHDVSAYVRHKVC